MMFIKSHVRGGWASMRDYLKNEGRFASNENKNEVVRLVGGQNLGSDNLTGMFREMWLCRSKYPAKTPVHHVSINPDPKGRALTDAEVWAVVERLKQKFRYDRGQHQCLVVQHVYKGRAHYHVIFNRVDMKTRKVVAPGNNKMGDRKLAKLVAIEMSRELGLEPVWSRKSRGKAYPKRKRLPSLGRKRKKSPRVKKSFKRKYQAKPRKGTYQAKYGKGKYKRGAQSNAAFESVADRPNKSRYAALDKRGGAADSADFQPGAEGQQHQDNAPPRSIRDYAGVLGVDETPHYERKGKSGKTGKGEGAGGGAGTILSAFRNAAEKPQRVSKTKHTPKNSGPNRRQKNKWVPVERRDRRPKPQ